MTKFTFPHLTKSLQVIYSVKIVSSPLENAIAMIDSKNKQLCDLETKFIKVYKKSHYQATSEEKVYQTLMDANKSDSSHFTMTLNGAIVIVLVIIRMHLLMEE